MEELFNKLKTQPFLIAGPCVIESEELCFEIAEKCKAAAEKLGFVYVFKASFDKANRTSVKSYRGVPIEEGLAVLGKIKDKLNVPVVTDIHESWQAEVAGKVCDILQIPAFLCRQTDLLVAAAKTDRIVNIKKAQFIPGNDMLYPIEKVRSAGNNKILLTERGTMFGYGNLVVDYKGVMDMIQFGLPVVMDMTHSTQKPGALGGTSCGEPRYAPVLAKAAAAIGVRGFFMETHPNPPAAKSDSSCMLHLESVESVLEGIKKHFV